MQEEGCGVTAPQPVAAPQAAGVSSADEILAGFRTIAAVLTRHANWLRDQQAGGTLSDKVLVRKSEDACRLIAAVVMPAPTGDQS